MSKHPDETDSLADHELPDGEATPCIEELEWYTAHFEAVQGGESNLSAALRLGAWCSFPGSLDWAVYATRNFGPIAGAEVPEPEPPPVTSAQLPSNAPPPLENPGELPTQQEGTMSAGELYAGSSSSSRRERITTAKELPYQENHPRPTNIHQPRPTNIPAQPSRPPPTSATPTELTTTPQGFFDIPFIGNPFEGCDLADWARLPAGTSVAQLQQQDGNQREGYAAISNPGGNQGANFAYVKAGQAFIDMRGAIVGCGDKAVIGNWTSVGATSTEPAPGAGPGVRPAGGSCAMPNGSAPVASQTRRCGSGMILGTDGLCYDKRSLGAEYRLYTYRRPVISWGDGNHVRKALAAIKRFDTYGKKIEELTGREAMASARSLSSKKGRELKETQHRLEHVDQELRDSRLLMAAKE